MGIEVSLKLDGNSRMTRICPRCRRAQIIITIHEKENRAHDDEFWASARVGASYVYLIPIKK